MVVKHEVLSCMLGSGRDLFDSMFAVYSLIRDLAGDAEILSDALHALIRDGNFGCPEDAAKAVFWAMLFDATGSNFLHEEFDTLRNGVALDLLLRDCNYADPAPSEEVPE